MSEDHKIIKFRRKKDLNIGMVVAFGVLVLLVINIYRFATTPQLSLYEVHEGNSGNEVPAVALILRSETTYNTEKAGYLNYYYREGARVTKDSDIYSVNDSSELQDILNMNEDSATLSENDLLRLKGTIREFCAEYSDTKFSESYSLREAFLSDYLRYRDVSALDTIANNGLMNNSFLTVTSPRSGIVSYFSDRLDGYTKEMLSEDDFSAEKRVVPEYKKQTGISAINEFAYKLIYDEKWQLVIQVPEEDKDKLHKIGDKVVFRISGDPVLYEKAYEEFRMGTGIYLLVEMERYGSDYLSERFLDVTLYIDANEGLKIPETSILTKEMYQIPERFIMKGGGENQNEVGISLVRYDAESGEEIPDYCKIDYLFRENGYYYVAEEDFDSGQYVFSTSLSEEPERAMLHSFLTEMEGVYNMNKGYAVFRRIERITDIEEYVLVKAGLSGGVALYDHIVLDVSAVSKDVILIEGES